MTVEGGGVDEIVKGKDVKETKGGSRRGKKRKKVADNSNLCIEAIVDQIVLVFILLRSKCLWPFWKYLIPCAKKPVVNTASPPTSPPISQVQKMT